MHKPIFLINISLFFANKHCFEDFSTQIYPGNHIAIIGGNGNGKSSLLKILNRTLEASSGQIIIPDNLHIEYVEQTIYDYKHLSGGERLNKRLSTALSLSPDLLLLDEPTNHLDLANRKSLIRMLQDYQGTLIIATHDTELLHKCTDILWHIDNNQIYIFSGSYSEYLHTIKQKQISIEKELSSLKRKKKKTHNSLMKEQERAKKRKAYGEKKYSGDKLALRGAQARGQMTCNKNNKFINEKKNALLNQLSEIYVPQIILPKFSLTTNDIRNCNILSIRDANIGYNKDTTILKNIDLSLSSKERIAIIGKNSSGKSTLLGAILGKKHIFKTGSWQLPNNKYIGYLDQHYSNLNPDKSVIDHLLEIKPEWNETKTRQHLNDFLFRKNEEVSNLVSNLSGGEKARLSLSIIAAQTPRLLILDEITNNLDLETKEHVIQVLKKYPGSIIIVSHEENFLQSICIDNIYKIEDKTIRNSQIY
ncbi:MAG: ABC-F family ATP-binding cassette domain-containing protein [Rickettsiales bacterium]|nr:ABC-F family ATP-binding cassette domain-containing protein [Rickettsiales bacterium]